MGITWRKKDNLHPVVHKALQPANVVLDIGCGIRPQTLLLPRVHICCEPFADYLEYLQRESNFPLDRLYVYFQATWQETVRLFPPRSVDTVFLLDIIEHLEKTEALELLKLTEGLARQQVVVFTPLGFLPQKHPDGIDAWGFHGGTWQEHKSGWHPEDFDSTWKIYATKVFHVEDNQGRPLEPPLGAFWAIKNLTKKVRSK